MAIIYGHFWDKTRMSLKTVSATAFKAQCLALLEQVRSTRQPLLVTRHGKPVAEISPHVPKASSTANPLKDSVEYQGDLIAPIDVDWNAPG
jgi:prevent-host-death family protein